ncbi:MAG TPA: universal stress protein [Lysobacter sp.]
MFKDILIPLVLGDLQEAAIGQACALAALDDGQVIGLVGASLAIPIATTWAYYPVGTYETMDEAATATVRKLAEAAEQRLGRENVAHEVRVSTKFWLTSAEMSTLHARYADLTVLGVSRPLQDPERRLFGGLLAGSGRPLLMVPASAPAHARFDRILIAWKSSREAARAVHDAMPLLQRAQSVELLMVEHEPVPGPHNADADVCLAGHLRRHGVPVTPVRRSAEHMPAAGVILEHARESGAQLIVAGGYSHSRALEQAFGGVTRHLLEHADVPVLLSH